MTSPALEIWGGVECTVNRVGDCWFDQMVSTGHAGREEDLELFAGLGLRVMRYPLLWERIAPNGIEAADWSWSDARLATLRRLGIRPIVGLVHHGSGPRQTGLIEQNFATELARFAGAVALRYPGIADYTPVNEPLTTARFAGLYGHWHPHLTDSYSYIRMLVNQCRAVVLSMRAIREVNPEARLVQTEDLGKTFSTPPLTYQADFENERRWLTFDLLCGRVGREHPLWEYLVWTGVPEEDFLWFADNPLPPDLMGINHYMTSERFLDHRVERYPEWLRGGNTFDKYADVEAVRALPDGASGPRQLLQEAWDRYGLPLAVTEAHLNCTREEQLRWLNYVWTAAQDLKEAGVDIRAVTAWSLLGSYDWVNLLTRADGHYEPGAFDLRAPNPRPTALASMIRELGSRGVASHPVLDSPGWWQKQSRLIYHVRNDDLDGDASVEGVPEPAEAPVIRHRNRPRPILIAGSTGTLGSAFVRLCHDRGLEPVGLTRRQMDIADAGQVEVALDAIAPWAIVNAAGYVRVDDAERDRRRCFRINTHGARVLATAAADRKIKFLTFSSDLVFGGEVRQPRVESDRPRPLNVYGFSKARAESAVLNANPAALVVRTSAFFGPWDEYNFVTRTLRALRAGLGVRAADDLVVSPTYVPDLVNATLDILIDDESGVWHLANFGSLTWADLARNIARRAELPESLVDARPARDLAYRARRPEFTVLGTERGRLLRSFEEAFEAYWRDSGVLDEEIPDPDLLEAGTA